jgi:hypothetical protein
MNKKIDIGYLKPISISHNKSNWALGKIITKEGLTTQGYVLLIIPI